MMSLHYNLLAIPIIISCRIYSILLFFEKEKYVEMIITKYKNVLIIFAILIFIIVEIININNYLLY